MNNYPDVTLQICTFRRPKEIRLTIEALRTHVRYPGTLRWLVCDDASGGTYLEDLRRDYPFLQCVSTPPRKDDKPDPALHGWGNNVNNGLGKINTEFILFTEDDYVLQAPLDLTPLVALMLVNQSIGYARLDGIVGHRLTAHMAESDLSLLLPHYMQSTGMALPGKCCYWLLDYRSQETWLYSNRPHFKHVRFHKYYGLYPTGRKLGATEEAFAHQVKDKLHEPGAPQIMTLPDWVVSHWQNIGVSFQHTQEDK